MAGEWKVEPLERLVDPERAISYGVVQPGVATSDGVPIVRVNDIRDGRIATTDPLRVSPQVEAAYARTRLRGGELLLTLVGTVGEAAVVPDSLNGWNTARAVAVIPVRADVGSYWVRLALRSAEVKHIIDSRLNTTVQATLNLRDVAQLPIVVPPERERRAIAHVLGTLDGKIELNRRMSETLEVMARTIFKSWFVDFDPVCAKADGDDPDLPRFLVDLFPDSFEDSELGEIPKGWHLETLASVASLNPECWGKGTRPDILNYIDLSSTKWGRIEEVTRYDRVSAPSRAQRRLRPGDTILGTVRPGNGSFALVADHGLTGSTGFAVLRPLKSDYTEFVYLAATSADNIDRLAHLADGGAYPAVPPEIVLATQVVKAPDKVVASFSHFTGELLARIAANERESRTLAAVRDTLLPKLISGELRIRDAERLAGLTETTAPPAQPRQRSAPARQPAPDTPSR